MKGVLYFCWTLLMFMVLMMTFTLSSASPIKSTAYENCGDSRESFNFQDELNQVIERPIHVTSRANNNSVKLRSIKNAWSSINGADYKSFPIGQGVTLMKRR
jgi:hypothetical protein